MPKPNLLALPVPVRRRETKTFTDPLQPDQEFTFTCEGPGTVEAARFSEKDEELQKRFVTGDKESPQPYAASRLPLLDKTSITVSSGMAQVFALAETLQCPESEEDRWTVPELGLLTKVAPNAYRDLANWLYDMLRNPYVMPERKDAAGNGSGLPPTT